MNAAQLTVNTSQAEKGTLIEAIGEVDLTTAGQLREIVMNAVNNNDKTALVVDLRQVDFIDSAGLALLVEARKRLYPEGRALHILLTAGRQPERVLKLGRFDSIMNLAYRLEDLP